MRREFITREEIQAQLRLQGIEDLAHVSCAYMEPNGMISAFPKDGATPSPTPHPIQP